jgi:hypothetical protein
MKGAWRRLADWSDDILGRPWGNPTETNLQPTLELITGGEAQLDTIGMYVNTDVVRLGS